MKIEGLSQLEAKCIKTLGSKINREIVKRDSSLRKLSSELKISLSSIARLVSETVNTTVNFSNILKISIGLKAPIESLFSDKFDGIEVDSFNSTKDLVSNKPAEKSTSLLDKKLVTLYKPELIFKLKATSDFTAYFIKGHLYVSANTRFILYQLNKSVEFGMIRSVDKAQYFISAESMAQVILDPKQIYAVMINPEMIKSSEIYSL